MIASADKLGELEMAAELGRLRAVAERGRLRTADITGGTFTISNLGMLDIDRVDPVVNPPQAAILGVGRIRIIPSYGLDGSLAPTPTVGLTLGVDHRAADGAIAALFLADLAATLEGQNRADATCAPPR